MAPGPSHRNNAASAKAIEVIEEIGKLSRRAFFGSDTDRFHSEMRACYLMASLVWGEEELFDEGTSADIEKRCPGMLRAVWSATPLNFGPFDIGYAAGLTCVWPLAEGVVERFIDDPAFGWRDIDATCVEPTGQSLDLYIDNVINFVEVLGTLFPEYAINTEEMGSSTSVNLLHQLARHMGDFLPTFTSPDSTGEGCPRLIAIIDESKVAGRFGRPRLELTANGETNELSDGQALVRSIGMRRLSSTSYWSKFWYDYGQPEAFSSDPKQRRASIALAKNTGKWRR